MEKSAEAFRTISEVSELLETPAHVLRFWESRFAQVKPLKRAGGRRYYRPSDLALLGGIKKLLHEDGMTIRGVQKILREQGVRHVAALSGLTIVAEGAGVPAAEAAAPATGSGSDSPMVPTGVAPATTAAPPPAEPAATATGSWPAPVPAQPEREAEEAPMDADVPTLPLGLPDNVRTIPAGAPAAATSDGPSPAGSGPSEVAEDAGRPPAAAMLRAMDALRAHDKKAELRVVYNRLTTLRDRLVERNRQTRN